jgi:hypothetical protein
LSTSTTEDIRTSTIPRITGLIGETGATGARRKNGENEMAIKIDTLSKATEAKKTMKDRLWEATVTRLGCMDYQWQMKWKCWGLSLRTEVDLDAFEDMNQYVVYTTICVGPLQVITYDVAFGNR